MCALAEKRTIDTLIDGGPQKSGDFDYSITQCKSFTSAESHPTRYYALITMILTLDNYLLGEKISQCTGNCIRSCLLYQTAVKILEYYYKWMPYK